MACITTIAFQVAEEKGWTDTTLLQVLLDFVCVEGHETEDKAIDYLRGLD